MVLEVQCTCIWHTSIYYSLQKTKGIEKNVKWSLQKFNREQRNQNVASSLLKEITAPTKTGQQNFKKNVIWYIYIYTYIYVYCRNKRILATLNYYEKVALRADPGWSSMLSLLNLSKSPSLAEAESSASVLRKEHYRTWFNSQLYLPKSYLHAWGMYPKHEGAIKDGGQVPVVTRDVAPWERGHYCIIATVWKHGLQQSLL